MKTKEEKQAWLNGIQSQQSAAVLSEAKLFVKNEGITSGWSVDQHAKFVKGLVVDVADTFMGVDTTSAGSEDDLTERNFRFHVILRETANYSAFRQKLEKAGALTVGGGKTAASLASEYLS